MAVLIFNSWSCYSNQEKDTFLQNTVLFLHSSQMILTLLNDCTSHETSLWNTFSDAACILLPFSSSSSWKLHNFLPLIFAGEKESSLFAWICQRQSETEYSKCFFRSGYLFVRCQPRLTISSVFFSFCDSSPFASLLKKTREREWGTETSAGNIDKNSLVCQVKVSESSCPSPWLLSGFSLASLWPVQWIQGQGCHCCSCFLVVYIVSGSCVVPLHCPSIQCCFECTCILSLEWSSGRFILLGSTLLWIFVFLFFCPPKIHESSDSIPWERKGSFSWGIRLLSILTVFFRKRFSLLCLILIPEAAAKKGRNLSLEEVYRIFFVIVSSSSFFRSLILSFLSLSVVLPLRLFPPSHASSSVVFCFSSRKETFSSLMSWTQWMASVSIT